MATRNSYKLLGIVQSYAPTGKEQAYMAELHSIAEADGMTENELCQLWARCLLDGLNYGNWPWVPQPRGEKI